ncbi:hypothetical protein RRG08_033511, partial [Elysia crispata]
MATSEVASPPQPDSVKTNDDHSNSGVQTTDSMDLVFDEDYNALRDHFLARGRGRRPSLPQIQSPTNKILLQLFLLREQSNSSWQEVMDWFEKLFELEVPDELTRGQLKYRCQAAHAAFSLMDSSEAKKFLSFCIVDNVDECLRRLGLTKSILLCSKPEGYVRVHNCKLTNEVVSALNAFAKTERLPTTFVNRWLCALTDIDISESQMRHLSGQILKKVSVLRKGKDRNLLNSFLKDAVQFIRKEQNKEAAE